jgi:ABC-type amino acid transport system permease subunit
METKRWFNPSQPQTLQIAVWLLYFNAVGGLLLGIANEQRWGYILGVVMAVLDVVLIVAAAGGVMDVFRGTVLISFLFAIALVALLLHPMSREYQRIWFR